jgi:hypothetical protein
MTVPVDLVVNTYERTYRDVLAPGLIAGIEADNQVRFETRTVLINNVDDPDDAVRLADDLARRGEIDRHLFVEEHLPHALDVCELRSEDLEPVPYFTDWALVAVTAAGPPWVLHWDAEARLRSPCDWVTPAIELMRRDPRILIANPFWNTPDLERSTFARDGDFAIGYGFSDQVWLARREQLARPIYGERCIARRRFPVAHLGEIFEARIDSFMRHHQRLRATHTVASYDHPPNMGTAYPGRTLAETARFAFNRLVTRALLASPVKPSCARYM